LFNYNILKVNKNESLLTNKYELNATLRILRDNKKEFSIKKEKLQIFINKIDEYIKKHHDKSLQRHLEVIKTLQLLRQHCRFLHMRQVVETYIKRCLSY
jgi:isochorismate hydrolase